MTEWWQQVLLGAAVVGAVVGACYCIVWLLCRVAPDVEQTVGVLEAEQLVQRANLDATARSWDMAWAHEQVERQMQRHERERAEADAILAASRVNPEFGDRLAEVFDDLRPARPQPSFVVAARLVGGMGDGEEVEVHSQLWLAHPPTELRVTARDETSTPPVVHHLLYRVSPEDSQVFVFAGVVPAPHELMGDE